MKTLLSEDNRAAIAFKIVEVESIPCDLRGQILVFDKKARLLSEPIKTPWPMPWVTDEISKLAANAESIPDKPVFRIYNPEEDDQYVLLSVEKY